jgi:hypothetical protein
MTAFVHDECHGFSTLGFFPSINRTWVTYLQVKSYLNIFAEKFTNISDSALCSIARSRQEKFWPGFQICIARSRR